MKDLLIKPISIIRKDQLQRVDISACVDAPGHYFLSMWQGRDAVVTDIPFSLNGGQSFATVWIPPQVQAFDADWIVTDKSGAVVARYSAAYTPPRRWTIYVMISSHCDLGLHRSQYIQREESARFIEMAQQLVAHTADRPEESRYRYVMEGTWMWSNYCRTHTAAEVEKALALLRSGDLGVCACVAGNHIHTYGLEELCRSTYSRQWLEDQGISCRTMTMIDVPGLPWSMIQPYADAGIENIIFAPNNWGPHLSTKWTLDVSKPWVINNPESCGGGSRIDVRYESNLPMLFYWQGQADHKMLVWASAQYGVGGERFGISALGGSVEQIYTAMGKHLPLMEDRYPYDLWLVESYEDNMEPELRLIDTITQWNAQFAYPQIRTLGDPDEPFDLVKQRFGDQIPTLCGDITNGWAQHPLAAAAVLADSMDTDRKLPTAEKLATLAALYAGKPYPAAEFERAWGSLIMNDEHSYGVGEYYGRDVVETWMQHRDWVAKAKNTAENQINQSLSALAQCIPGDGRRLLVFNPTAQSRREQIHAQGVCLTDLPPFGYRVIPAEAFSHEEPATWETDAPPEIENSFYRITFAPNGALQAIFDKEFNRFITNGNCNELLYTRDNHRHFHAPTKARFRICSSTHAIQVTVQTQEPVSGAELIQTVTLPAHEKRIDLNNRVLHVRDMIVSDRKDRSRYDRFLYFAFPFDVENCRRWCDLGGVEAEYGVDLTGHSTDVYMAAHEYCCAENDEIGVGLIQLDSQLVEFDHIHPDKTDFSDPGNGSAVFSYVANSWFHHKHLPGGNSICYRFRYTITSYAGSRHKANLRQMAERIANPPVMLELQAPCGGDLPPEEMSFLTTSARLVNLKRAADGNGIVLRLHSLSDPEPLTIHSRLKGVGPWDPVSIDEKPLSEWSSHAGFTTWRSTVSASIPAEGETPVDPLAIGAVYTGLISIPRAASAFDAAPGTMYLLWGKCAAECVYHYELYRSTDPDFTPDSSNFVASVECPDYCVGRYVDQGLTPDTTYFYRLRAVTSSGTPGPFSEVFSGLSRE